MINSSQVIRGCIFAIISIALSVEFVEREIKKREGTKKITNVKVKNKNCAKQSCEII